MDYADLEISLHRRTNNLYTIEGRFSPASDAADMRLGAKKPVEMHLDFPALDDCLPDMEQYGQILTNAFFVSEVKNLFLYAVASVGDQSLRFRLLIGPTAPELQGVHWETLRHPIDGSLLAANQNILFSRYLSSENWTPIRLADKKQVRALLAVAGPSDLESYKFSPIDVQAELERAKNNLPGVETISVPTDEIFCTLSALMSELREGYDVLYLVAHGSLVSDIPYLWLENDAGKVARVDGNELAHQIGSLSKLPGLVILVSCESAGKESEDKNDSQALKALGPILAGAGIPAVIAMQGKISTASASRMMPVFFEELVKDGQVDRALAAARGALQTVKASDIWMPVLFSRLKNGKIWREDQEKKQLSRVQDTVQRLFYSQWMGVLAVIAVLIVGGVWLYFSLLPPQKPKMTADFCIAIASFVEDGENLPDKVGYVVGDGIRTRLDADLKEFSNGPTIEIWGPDRVGTITGKTPAERAANAEKLAKEIGAFMVIYGIVESNGDEMLVVPEFYLDTTGFNEGNEVIGQYELGAPFSLPAGNDANVRYDFNKKMYSRSQVIASLSSGLSLFAVHRYQEALEIFSSIDNPEAWDDNNGKKVLYILTGFAAGKVGDEKLDQRLYDEADANFSLAEDLLRKALEIDPQYARPYIGIANLNYMRALVPYQQSKDRLKIDKGKLETCLEYLEKADQAQNKPPLAEVETKIHFARGQCLMQQTLAGVNTNLEPAFNEFRWVTQKYAQEKNERIKELAGEAHARVGLIYRLLGKNELAIPEYQTAIELLSIYPERKATYENALATLTASTPAP